MEEMWSARHVGRGMELPPFLNVLPPASSTRLAVLKLSECSPLVCLWRLHYRGTMIQSLAIGDGLNLQPRPCMEVGVG